MWGLERKCSAHAWRGRGDSPRWQLLEGSRSGRPDGWPGALPRLTLPLCQAVQRCSKPRVPPPAHSACQAAAPKQSSNLARSAVILQHHPPACASAWALRCTSASAAFALRAARRAAGDSAAAAGSATMAAGATGAGAGAGAAMRAGAAAGSSATTADAAPSAFSRLWAGQGGGVSADV
jgi:hypothetical protein